MSAPELTRFACCLHCGCTPDERAGHPDHCSYGCNEECFTCRQPRDSAGHHAECVAPLDQVEGGA